MNINQNPNQKPKVTFIKVNNPFNHSEREIKQIEYIPGATVADYARKEGYTGVENNDNEIVLSMNGHVVENMGLPVKAGSYIAMTPAVRGGGNSGGKNTLALIAGIALSVVSMGVGSVVSGGAFFGGLGVGAWSWAGYLAALAVMWVGGMLISRMTPKPEMDIPQQSVAYSWNPGYLLQGQGHSLGLIYGTVKPALVVLSQHISSDGEKQYLNLILCVGDGPIDSIGNIRINDNPIANFADVKYDYRLGTNNQTGFDRSNVLNFTDTYADQPLSYEIEPGVQWYEHQLDGNSANGLEIEFTFPNGLYHVEEDGSTTAASVVLEAEYRRTSLDPEVQYLWSNFFTGGLKIDSMTQNGAAYSGTGPIYNISAGNNAVAEVWTITCTEAQSGAQGYLNAPSSYAKKFSVVGSVSGAKPDAVFGTHYSNNLIGFDISSMYFCTVGYVFTVTIGAQTSVTISSASTSAIRRSYRVDNVAMAQYDVRVRCTYRSGTTIRDITRVFWTQLSSIIYDDFVRPGKALIGLKALATGQLSGTMPNITCTATRSTVRVFNPTANAYQLKAADNPAWAAYDMIHRAKLLYNFTSSVNETAVFGAPKEKMIYQDFSDWADFCDSKSLKVNYYVEKATDIWTALREMENCGRGKVILRGTRFGAICDNPSDPVQLFTVGNIIKDTFREEFLPMKDRANSLEVTFNNKDKNYERDVITVYGDTYDSETTVKHPTQITLDGITDFAQAYKEAKYRLRLNKYLTRTVSFEAGVDAIACQVGDVILVQHDVPQWGFGGRIINVNGRILTLDREITFAAATDYSIMVRLSATDVIVQKMLVQFAQETTTATVTVTTDFTSAPAKHDVYTLGELNVEAKPFRVANITRATDMTRRITALEYVADVYDEATDVPDTNYSALTPYVDASNIQIGQETYAQKDGTIVSVLYVSWTAPRNRQVQKYHVYYTHDNVNWFKWGETEETSITITGVKALKTYLIHVSTQNEIGTLSPGVLSAPCYVTGKDLPPNDVTGLTITQDPNDKRNITLEWTGVTNVDLRGYLVKENGISVSNYLTDTKYNFQASATRTYNFTVYSVDTSGNLSTNPATASVSITVEPSNITGFTASADPYDRTKVLLSWNALTEVDLSYYEVRRGDSWLDSAVIQHTKATSFIYSLPTSGFHRFWIKAVTIGGKYSVTEAGADGQFNFSSSAPVNGVITQDLNDRTRLVISWDAVADADVSGYEVRLGQDWTSGALVGIVKEASITHIISASGSYNFMIRAKNVAGYYSSTLNVAGTFTIEPSNISGFTGAQFSDTKSKVRLSWNATPERDTDHYEIRQGETWAGGTLVSANVAGTFYDVTISLESTYKWWIKAVSKAGKYSVTASSFSALFSMNPSAPTNLTAVTDPADRTKANITWTGIADLDLLEYELRWGVSWEDSALIIKTKETRVTWAIPDTEVYHLMIRARNTALFESDEVSYFYSATVEPSNVTGFKAVQNGENILLTWNKVTDVDFAHCEIREGITWDTGALIVSGVTLPAYQFLAEKEMLRHFMIKAVNRAGKYSDAEAKAFVVIANLLPRNVILTYDEIDDPTGTHNDTVFGASAFKYSTLGGQFSEYDTTKFSDIGGSNVLKLDSETLNFSNIPGTFATYPSRRFSDELWYQTNGEYTTGVMDVGKVLTANITANFTTSVLFTAGTSARLYYRISTYYDPITESYGWPEWLPFVALQTTFRYVQFKAVLTTDSPGKTPEVNQFELNIDVPDMIKNGNQTVAVGGTTINYGYTFYAVPSVVAMATTLGNRAELNGEPDKGNFTVKVFDSGGNDVGGQVLWIARGY